MSNTLINCNSQKRKKKNKLKTKSHNSVSERAVLFCDIQECLGFQTTSVSIVHCFDRRYHGLSPSGKLPNNYHDLFYFTFSTDNTAKVYVHIHDCPGPYRSSFGTIQIKQHSQSIVWLYSLMKMDVCVCVAPHFQEGELESDLKLLMTKALHGKPCFLLQHQGVGKCAYKLRQQQCPKCTQS